MSYTLSLVMVVIFVIALAVQPREADPFAGEGFEIGGGGKLVHFEPILVTPGSKPPVTSVNAAAIITCVTGADPSCIDGITINTDPGGKVYLFMISDTVWKVSTKTNCSNATTLTGVVGGNGTFMMAGTHALSNSRIILQGKVTFTKGTFVPTGMKGAKLTAVSDTQDHYGTGTVSTVASVPAACP